MVEVDLWFFASDDAISHQRLPRRFHEAGLSHCHLTRANVSVFR